MIWKILKWTLIITICFILFRMFITPSNEYCKETHRTIENIDVKVKNDSADIGFIIPIKYGNVNILSDSTATMTVSQFYFIIGKEYRVKKYTYTFDKNKKYINRIEINKNGN